MNVRSRKTDSGERGFGRFLVPVLIAIAAVAYVSDAVSEHRQISPVDEYVYADYLYKVPSQGFVRHGEETGDEARDLISCLGVIDYGYFGSACGSATHPQDELYPYGGGTGADIYPPVYFAVTWASAEVAATATGGDLFDAARWMGSLWLAAGLLTFLALLRQLKIDRWVSFGLALVIAVSPAVFWADTYVSTDAPALLAGSGIAYLSLRLARKEISGLWLLLVGPLVVLAKIQFLSAVVFGAVFLFLVVSRESPWRGVAAWVRLVATDLRSRYAVAALSVSVASQVAWMVFRSTQSVGGNVDQGLSGTTGIGGILAEAFKFLGGAAQASGSIGTVRDSLGVLLSWVCISGVVGVALVGGQRTVGRLGEGVPVEPLQHVWAVSALVAALATGPALALAASGIAGQSFALPGRYGLALLPVFVSCFALLVPRHRLSSVIVAGVGVSALLLSLYLDYAG